MSTEHPIEILVVDDRDDQRLALSAALGGLPIRIVEAASGRDALRCLLQRDFAVILLDIDMPGLNGFETAALIRQRKRSEHTPIIFVTAYGDDTQTARGYSLGAVDYVLTPFDPQVIRTKVAVFVELFRKTEELERGAQSMQRQAGQLRRLADASVKLHKARSLDELIDILADEAEALFDADEVAVQVHVGPSALGLHDPYSRLRSVCRPRDSSLPSLGLPALSRLGGKVMHASPEQLAARSEWPALERSGAVLPCGDWLGVPLLAHDGQAFGALQLAKRSGGFPTDDEALLAQLSQIAAIAVENRVFSEAEEANRAKDQFLATLSHELRTPLQAILSWTAILREDGEAALIDRGLEVIERSAQSQRKLIDDLLDVSRIITNKLRIESRPMRLARVVEGAVEAARAAAENDGVELVYRRDESAMHHVLGDPNRLQQVFGNLISNAIKFTPREGRVEVSVTERGNQLEVRIADTGRGIAKDFLAHLFERFRQADSTSTRTHAGLGIGLAIVQHLVDLHGGSVSAESPGEGRGSTFRVRLPVLVTEAEPVPIELAYEAELGRDADLTGMSILLVDDEADAREGIALLLRKRGADVTAVPSAHAALSALEARAPDILISDLAMPEDDGFSLIQRVRKRDAQRGGSVPALALSAYARPEESAQAMAAGFDMHLAKPVDERSLVATLTRLVAPPRR